MCFMTSGGVTLARVSPKRKKRKRNRKKYQGGETKMQLWPPRRRRKKLWLFDRRFSKKTWGKLTGFFPDTKYRLSHFFFAKVLFSRKPKKKPRISPLIRNWHSSRQSYRRRRSKGAKKEKRHYVIIVGETAPGRLGEAGKKKAYFRAFDQSDGAWRSRCQIYRRRSIRQKKSWGENNNNDNNISIHSFDLGKSKRDFPGRNYFKKYFQNFDCSPSIF